VGGAVNTIAIKKCIDDLRNEEIALTEQIFSLSGKIQIVRRAISALNPPLAGCSYSGLKFSQALEQFMLTTVEPMRATTIAHKLEELGYVFAGKAKSTQVLVTLRRGDGKLYQRDGYLWTTKKA
jgi:hypothetical protein